MITSKIYSCMSLWCECSRMETRAQAWNSMIKRMPPTLIYMVRKHRYIEHREHQDDRRRRNTSSATVVRLSLCLCVVSGVCFSSGSWNWLRVVVNNTKTRSTSAHVVSTVNPIWNYQCCEVPRFGVLNIRFSFMWPGRKPISIGVGVIGSGFRLVRRSKTKIGSPVFF
jgi:hypothetical protein